MSVMILSVWMQIVFIELSQMMRSLKEIRLVYRQHLLPPLVVPFERILEYRKMFESNPSSLEEKQNQEQLQRIIQIHQTVMTQLIKMRNSYISPLKACPFYYQFLDRKVRSKLFSGQWGEKSYLEAITEIPPSERFKVHQNFYNQYIAFKNRLEEQDPSFYQHVVYLPILKYQSPQELALSLNIDWNELTELQRIEMQKKYQSKLEKHWKKLDELARKSSLSVDELVELMKNQFNPPISSGLKNLLFA